MELACDRAVVRTDDDVTAYAEQLYAILVQARQQRQRTMATGLFATRTQINTRIAALLGNSLNTPARLGIAAVLSLVLFAGTVFAVGGAIADREDAKEETAGEETEQSLPSPQAPALQAKCESLLEGEAGAIVVLNADTGAVLAMTSAPFGTMKEVIEGQKVSGNASPIRPAYTRAYQEQYPPGSTFKILLAAAALEEGVITPDTTHYCGGSYRINGEGRAWGCWKRDGHGRVNVTDAMVYSCDVFFYNVGLSLGVDKINAWSRKFGLGISTGIDLPREISGLIPSQEWKKQIFADKTVSEQKWYPGDTVNLSIGQGRSAVTPLQNAVMMAAITNSGYRVTPRMNAESPPDRSERMLSDATLEVLHAALRKTVEKAPPDYPAGTGWRAGIDGIDILGKTGSAQIMSAAQWSKYASDEEIPYEMRDHAWFVAGVMDREPKISVSVLLEHGMHGGTGAAEIARAVIAEAYGIETSVREKTVVIDGKTVTLTTTEDPLEVEVPAQLSGRTLNFPNDRSLGALYSREPIDLSSWTSEIDSQFHDLDGWEFIGRAQGAIQIPSGKMVRLNVDPRWLDGLDEAFATLPPDAIQYLDLDGHRVSSDGLRPIAAWTGLEALNLADTGISDADLIGLRSLKNLRWLDLEGARLISGDLTTLSALTELRHLSLADIDLSGGTKSGVDQLGDLTTMTLRESGLNRLPLQCVGALPQLLSLNLRGTGVSSEQLRDLAGLSQLAALNLDNCGIANEDLKQLAPFKHLKELSLVRTNIAEGYKEALATLPGLTSVDVDYTAAPDAEHQMLVLGGRVVDEEGRPASGVLVSLYGVDGQTIIQSWATGTSKSDGRWEVRLLSGWSGLMVSLTSDAYVSDTSIGTRPVPPDAQLLDHTAELVVTRGASVSGTVRNEARTPIPGVRVVRDGKSLQSSPAGDATASDPNGKFTIHHVDDARMSELLFLTPFYAPGIAVLNKNNLDTPLDITLDVGAPLQGDVRDATGIPVEGAVIRVSSWHSEERHALPGETRTYGEGKFTLPRMPVHGEITISIGKYGFFNSVLTTTLPAPEAVQAILVEKRPFRGRVIDAETEMPVADFNIELAARSAAQPLAWQPAIAEDLKLDPDTGEFAATPRAWLDATAITEFSARVTAEGYAAAESAPLTADRLGEVVIIALQPLDPDASGAAGE